VGLVGLAAACRTRRISASVSSQALSTGYNRT
jgi:hypothetical protein